MVGADACWWPQPWNQLAMMLSPSRPPGAWARILALLKPLGLEQPGHFIRISDHFYAIASAIPYARTALIEATR
jgi:hypothetical protein